MKTTMPASLAALLRHPRARWAGLAALAGGLGFVVVGDTPATGGDMAASEVAWSVAPPGAPDLAAAQSIFAASAVWASQPAPVVSADAPPPPPAPRGSLASSKSARREAPARRWASSSSPTAVASALPWA